MEEVKPVEEEEKKPVDIISKGASEIVKDTKDDPNLLSSTSGILTNPDPVKLDSEIKAKEKAKETSEIIIPSVKNENEVVINKEIKEINNDVGGNIDNVKATLNERKVDESSLTITSVGEETQIKADVPLEKKEDDIIKKENEIIIERKEEEKVEENLKEVILENKMEKEIIVEANTLIKEEGDKVIKEEGDKVIIVENNFIDAAEINTKEETKETKGKEENILTSDEKNQSIESTNVESFTSNEINKIPSPSVSSPFTDREKDGKYKIYKAAFDKIDKDGSGSIDSDELVHLLQEIGMDDSQASIDDAIKFLDKDGSRSIEIGEFLKWTEFAWKNVALSPSAEKEGGFTKKVNKILSPSSLLGEEVLNEEGEEEEESKKGEYIKKEDNSEINNKSMENEKQEDKNKKEGKAVVSDIKKEKKKKEIERKKKVEEEKPMETNVELDKSSSIEAVHVDYTMKEVIKMYHSGLHYIFNQYSGSLNRNKSNLTFGATPERHIPLMNFSEFLKLTKDFSLYPQLLTKEEVTAAFKSCTSRENDIHQLSEKQFISTLCAMGTCAISKEPFLAKFPHPVLQIEILLRAMDLDNRATLREKIRSYNAFSTGDGSVVGHVPLVPVNLIDMAQKILSSSSLDEYIHMKEKAIVDEREKLRTEKEAAEAAVEKEVLHSISIVNKEIETFLMNPGSMMFPHSENASNKQTNTTFRGVAGYLDHLGLVSVEEVQAENQRKANNLPTWKDLDELNFKDIMKSEKKNTPNITPISTIKKDKTKKVEEIKEKIVVTKKMRESRDGISDSKSVKSTSSKTSKKSSKSTKSNKSRSRQHNKITRPSRPVTFKPTSSSSKQKGASPRKVTFKKVDKSNSTSSPLTNSPQFEKMRLRLNQGSKADKSGGSGKGDKVNSKSLNEKGSHSRSSSPRGRSRTTSKDSTSGRSATKEVKEVSVESKKAPSSGVSRHAKLSSSFSGKEERSQSHEKISSHHVDKSERKEAETHKIHHTKFEIKETKKPVIVTKKSRKEEDRDNYNLIASAFNSKSLAADPFSPSSSNSLPSHPMTAKNLQAHNERNLAQNNSYYSRNIPINVVEQQQQTVKYFNPYLSSADDESNYTNIFHMS